MARPVALKSHMYYMAQQEAKGYIGNNAVEMHQDVLNLEPGHEA